jgi:hypothetical protein
MDSLENTFIPSIDPVFTRYLYVFQDVYWSLLICILKNEKEDAIFWAYELYYSGFQLKVILFLEFIYSECFENVNSPKVKRFLEKKIRELRIHPNKEWVLATIVATMCSRQCDMNCILVKQSGCSQGDSIDKKNRKLIYPIYQEKDISGYKTVAVGDLRNWEVLTVVCSRSTYKDSEKLIQSNDCDSDYLTQILTHRYSREELTRMFRYEWEYYSYFTPIWKKRFEHYSAVLNLTNKKVEFPSENIEEMFYQKYGYEPDEQPIHVLSRCIGGPL